MTKRRSQTPSVTVDESNTSSSSSTLEKEDSPKSERINDEELSGSGSISDSSASTDDDDDSSDDDEDRSTESEPINVSLAEIRHAIALSTQAASKTFGWKTTTTPTNNAHNNEEQSNELTSIIPGYTAPMSLDSSALDSHKLSSLTKCVSEPATTTPPILSSTQWTKTFKHQSQSAILSQKSKTNAGANWFGMEATPDSESLATDIAVIRNRNYLDPKRFYKSSEFKKGKDIGVVQLGTVVEGAMESIYTNRLTKKQRKGTVMEEVMGEVFETKHDYVKKTFGKLQRKKTEMGRRGKRPDKKVKQFK